MRTMAKGSVESCLDSVDIRPQYKSNDKALLRSKLLRDTNTHMVMVMVKLTLTSERVVVGTTTKAQAARGEMGPSPRSCQGRLRRGQKASGRRGTTISVMDSSNKSVHVSRHSKDYTASNSVGFKHAHRCTMTCTGQSSGQEAEA